MVRQGSTVIKSQHNHCVVMELALSDKLGLEVLADLVPVASKLQVNVRS